MRMETRKEEEDLIVLSPKEEEKQSIVWSGLGSGRKK